MTADRADATVRLPADREHRMLLARLFAEGYGSKPGAGDDQP